jgi:hypothetical protein
MSVNWHYFKVLQNRFKQTAATEIASKAITPGSSKDLKQLTDYTVD